MQTSQTSGYCSNCGKNHSLVPGPAKDACEKLMRYLEENQRIDYLSAELTNGNFSTKNLFGSERGKMFGVLTGCDHSGKRINLYAFSGQFNGHWLVPGWVPPLFDVPAWHNIHDAREKEIKRLSRLLEAADSSDTIYQKLKRKRKQLSRQLMQKLQTLYSLRNFHGDHLAMKSLFSKSAPPTGAGDCCAPKLLQYAASNAITPDGIAEFYWGKTNLSETKRHKTFYPPCEDKCKPILGFMLCGLKTYKKMHQDTITISDEKSCDRRQL